ncbi:Phage-related holin (Lysis protein) [Gemella morbillorum]|jgi:toxin secretion/phage lysis holin|uniref:phage holin family protein n=1 Tax=Gemella morbillorum TaxID=29391 RepID=UPI000DA2BEAE|nr:phage holin family protein [Gemella morbillorum]UBH80410.1 phage holin family protein [Gemella morbillorum]SQH55803.1 Phage-related holin (Lysis protein) [Gemella morbillorum]DAT98883.1 MAG TPA: holin [Caudoviricetes sp.]
MNTLLNYKLIISSIGGVLGAFLGGMDGLIYALLAFSVIDYVTGIMCAIDKKELSSSVGFKGIARKIIIFSLVGVANILDVYILGHVGVLRAAVIFFYLSNEGISILENTSKLGLPVPEKLQNILQQLNKEEK